MKTTRYITIITLLFISLDFFGQHGHGRGRGHGGKHNEKVVVVKRSPYRPAKVVVYHPYWRPAYTYHRRWVYFPKYNIYWDNWRNHYVYLNGAVWMSQPTPPSIIVNINLADEPHQELPEDRDDIDEVYVNPK